MFTQLTSLSKRWRNSQLRSPFPSVAIALALILSGNNLQADEPFTFEDVTAKSGIGAVLESHPQHRPWRYAHGAGWGDANGDGRPDLFIGAFAARKWYEGDDAPVPNRLLLNTPTGFRAAEQAEVQSPKRNARCAGVLWADLDNDGDLDLLVANHVQRDTHEGSRLYENHGDATFRDVTPRSADWPGRIGMRNATALDVDRDGRLDLLLADGSYGKQAEQNSRLIVLQNQGKFRFSEVSARLGLPQQATIGLGLAVGDVNQDGWPDVFVAGSNRLFVSDGSGNFREAHPGRFSAPPADVAEGVHCGAALADLNGDDLLDLVTTEHGVPTRIHVYQNRGVKQGVPDLVEVSKAAGVGDLFPTGTRRQPIKTTHAALRDMDNDGRADLVLAVLFSDPEGRQQPVVLRNLSQPGGPLKFSKPPFERMTGYYAPAPLADYDRDGRVDIFMASWFEQLPNYLFRNTTPGGNWLTVRVAGDGQSLNTMGIGAVVRVFEAGRVGDAKHQLARHDIAVGTGYASCEEPLAHFGLGEHKMCDVQVRWAGRTIERKNVAVNQLLEIAVER
jgi:hypothetical protein